MSISRRRFAATALAGLAQSLPVRLQALRPRPKLFVVLIAEQFSQAYLDNLVGQFEGGGFLRLIQDGAYYPNCRLEASSFTASGLATLVTGAFPQLHGIIADRWYDRRAGTPAKARADMMEATTLAEEITRADKDGLTKTQVFCLGLDESLTSLLAGRAPARSFWMDVSGQFTTHGSPPPWLAPHNRSNSIESFHDAKWRPDGAEDDALPLRTLTFDPKRPEDFLALYKASPFGQKAQFELLRKLLVAEKLGQEDTLDFVFVSLGSMSLLGYETGSQSVLMEQMVFALDREIRDTLAVLEKTVKAGNFNLIFAGAHGAPPDPSPAARPQMTVSGETIARAVNRAISEWLFESSQKNTYVDKYVYPFLYLKLDALRKQNVPLRGARRLAGEVALRQRGVAGYYTADGVCSHSGEWRRRFENSFHALRSGDVMLSYAPEIVEEFGAGRGISYGSLYNYDTRVPLIFFGPQFGPRVIEHAVESVDLAPTLARAAGVNLPSSATGNVLADAFAEEKRGK